LIFGSVPRSVRSYDTFPSIASANGRQHLVFRVAGETTVSAAARGVPVHHDLDSRIYYSFSVDHGTTWSQPQEIFHHELGASDPGITVLSNGDLLVRITLIDVQKSVFRKKLRGSLLAHRLDLGTVSSVAGHVVLSSNDLGLSWQIVSDDLPILGFVSREPILELPDKSLILSGYVSLPTSTEYSVLLRSYDSGISWEDMSVIARDKVGTTSCYSGENYNESAVVYLPDDSLLALIRTDSSYFTNDSCDFMTVGGIGNLRVARSYNAGLSWTLPVDTGICGQPASAILVNEDVYVVYARRRIPYCIACRKSTDYGTSWGAEFVVREGINHWDFGYPTVTQSGSNLIVAYYLPRADGTRFIETVSFDARLVANDC
jgi:hypothetical protein